MKNKSHHRIGFLTVTVVLPDLNTLSATAAASPATEKEAESDSRTLGSIELNMLLK